MLQDGSVVPGASIDWGHKIHRPGPIQVHFLFCTKRKLYLPISTYFSSSATLGSILSDTFYPLDRPLSAPGQTGQGTPCALSTLACVFTLGYCDLSILSLPKMSYSRCFRNYHLHLTVSVYWAISLSILLVYIFNTFHRTAAQLHLISSSALLIKRRHQLNSSLTVPSDKQLPISPQVSAPALPDTRLRFHLYYQRYYRFIWFVYYWWICGSKLDKRYDSTGLLTDK